MGQTNQKWDKILQLFFEYSNHKFKIREISKLTKVPSSSVQRYLERLKKEGLVSKENRANIIPYFKFNKTFFIIDKLFKTGLINYLEETLKPSTIVVFGSARKGEYEKESDIDIFVESTIKRKLDLKEFEKKLEHNIQLFIRKNIKELPKDLFNNVLNGIKLAGYLKIK